MASIWATNSHAVRSQVGALIVKGTSIISDGYNGTPSGFDNCCEEYKCPDENLKGTAACDLNCPKCDKALFVTKPIVLHAEANAILKLAKSTLSSDGSTLYVTMSPCLECSKLIIQAGIKRVVYGILYRDDKGLQLLNDAGITTEKIEK